MCTGGARRRPSYRPRGGGESAATEREADDAEPADLEERHRSGVIRWNRTWSLVVASLPRAASCGRRAGISSAPISGLTPGRREAGRTSPGRRVAETRR